MIIPIRLQPPPVLFLLPSTLADGGKTGVCIYQERKSPHPLGFTVEMTLSPYRPLFLIKSSNQIILL